MVGEVCSAMDARIGAMALWQVGLERLHHCGGHDGRPCGDFTPEKRISVNYAWKCVFAKLFMEKRQRFVTCCTVIFVPFDSSGSFCTERCVCLIWNYTGCPIFPFLL